MFPRRQPGGLTSAPATGGSNGWKQTGESKAIGGLALWAVPYILDNLALENFDEVIFEISTCLRYSESDPQRYIDDLSYVLSYCCAKNIAIRFLQLYRGDIDYEADKLSQVVTDFCASHNLIEISLIDAM